MFVSTTMKLQRTNMDEHSRVYTGCGNESILFQSKSICGETMFWHFAVVFITVILGNNIWSLNLWKKYFLKQVKIVYHIYWEKFNRVIKHFSISCVHLMQNRVLSKCSKKLLFQRPKFLVFVKKINKCFTLTLISQPKNL